MFFCMTCLRGCQVEEGRSRAVHKSSSSSSSALRRSHTGRDADEAREHRKAKVRQQILDSALSAVTASRDTLASREAEKVVQQQQQHEQHEQHVASMPHMPAPAATQLQGQGQVLLQMQQQQQLQLQLQQQMMDMLAPRGQAAYPMLPAPLSPRARQSVSPRLGGECRCCSYCCL